MKKSLPSGAMIVVLFHALYLLGSYVLRRYVGIMPESEQDAEESHQDSMSKEMKERVNLKRRFSDAEDEEGGSNVRFHPPAYIQRYQAVKDVLADPRYNGQLRKVVDFGCSELSFHLYLKNLAGVKEVLFVDVDGLTLDTYKNKVKPLHIDYLHKRSTPLVMHVIEGSVNQHDKLLEDCDAVVCIELIEHLYPEDLTNFPYSIFGFVRPKVAVVTTPNADFNVLFDKMTGFRHWDHKFEWTRNQFEDWANNIISRFPDYEVTFSGIANGPPGTENLGACSQMAIFNKKYDLPVQRVPGVEGLFKTIKVFEFPYEVDNRSDEEKILEDAIYFIRKLSFNENEFEEEIPLDKILETMNNVCSSDQLTQILRDNNWTVVLRENGPVVLVPPPSNFSDNSFLVENFLDEFDDGSDGDPGPQNDYYYRREVELDDNVVDDVDVVDDEDWENEPHIIVQNMEYENHDLENFSSNEELEDDSNTSSINPDDVNLDDIETESRSSELDNSLRDESILISSFSETRGSENSGLHAQASSTNIENNIVDLHNSESSCLEERNLENPENSVISGANDNNVSTYISVPNSSVDNSSTSAHLDSEDISHLESNDSQPDTQNMLILKDITTVSNSDENIFNEPKYTSSPHLLTNLSKRRRIDNGESFNTTSSSNKSMASCANKISKDMLQNNSQPNDLNSSSNSHENLENEVSENVPKFNKPKSTENEMHHTGAIPKTSNRQILDLEVNAQTVAKIERITPNTPESLINSSSPEVMDSGYPNSSSPPDLSPEHDLSSIAQDNESNSESPSIEDAPRIGLFEVEVENRDLANNNLDGEGNNLEADVGQRANDLQPLINVLENDIQNENDIYVGRNDFPDWLLRIQ